MTDWQWLYFNFAIVKNCIELSCFSDIYNILFITMMPCIRDLQYYATFPTSWLSVLENILTLKLRELELFDDASWEFGR